MEGRLYVLEDDLLDDDVLLFLTAPDAGLLDGVPLLMVPLPVLLLVPMPLLFDETPLLPLVTEFLLSFATTLFRVSVSCRGP